MSRSKYIRTIQYANIDAIGVLITINASKRGMRRGEGGGVQKSCNLSG